MDPYKVALLFDAPYPKLFDILIRITAAEIQGLNSSQFLYEMTQASETGFFINIKSLKSKEIPLLIVNIYLSFEILSNPEVQLSTTHLTLSLWNYIDKDSPEMKEVQQTASTVKGGDVMAKTSSNLAAVIGGAGSSSIIKGANLAESIKILRYD